MGREIIDNNGRRWGLAININTAMRIQEKTGYNLLADTYLLSPEPSGLGIVLPQLECDPIQLAQVLYAAVQEEAEARHVTQAMFLAAWDEQSLKKAYVVLIEAVCDFFPSRAERIRQMVAALTEGREKISRLMDQVATGAKDILDQVSVEELAKQALLDAAQKFPTFGNQSSSLPVRSASIPVPGH